MFDSIATLTDATLGMRFWCLFLVLFTISISWRVNYNYTPNKPLSILQGNRTKLIFFCFFLLSLTWWIDGDYFSYILHAKTHDVNWIFDDGALLEKGHQAICSLVNGDWLGYRIVCWGTALTLFMVTARRFGINIQHALFCLFILWHHTFCYGRVTLAMAIYFYGISFLCKPLDKKLISYIIGVIIILCCSYFHRSALLLIVSTPAIFVLTVKKRVSLPYILLCVFLIFWVVLNNIDMLYQTEDWGEDTMNYLQSYSEREFGVKTIYGLISTYIKYAAIYMPVALITYVMVKYRESSIPQEIKMLYSLMIILFTISIAFYFTGEAQFTIFYRTLNFIMIPSSLILAFLHLNGIMSKRMFLGAIGFGLLSDIWKVFYSIYSF